MVVFLRSQEQAQHLDAQREAAARTVEITKEQYTQGEVDFTPVFLFESILTEQQDQLAVSRGDIALGLIAVYRALGGGWQIRLGGGNTAVEPIDLEMLEEMPAPEDEGSDIQFQSFISECAYLKPTDQPSATVATPVTAAVPAKFVGTTGN